MSKSKKIIVFSLCLTLCLLLTSIAFYLFTPARADAASVSSQKGYLAGTYSVIDNRGETQKTAAVYNSTSGNSEKWDLRLYAHIYINTQDDGISFDSGRFTGNSFKILANQKNSIHAVKVLTAQLRQHTQSGWDTVAVQGETNKTLTGSTNWEVINATNLSDGLYKVYMEIEFSYNGYHTAYFWSNSVGISIDNEKPTVSLSPSNGISNSSVTVSSDKTISSLRYTRSTDGTMPTAVANETSLRTFNDEGKYAVQVYDVAGNVSNVKNFTIDKTAPILNVSRTNNSILKSGDEVTFSASDNYSATADIAITLNGQTYTGATTKITIDNTWAEQEYIITAKDTAGNTSTSTFRVDRTAPTINVSCGNGNYSKANVTVTGADIYGLTLKYSRNNTTFPTSAATTFATGQVFETEGFYSITATDTAGNISSATFAIDKTAPTIAVSKTQGGEKTAVTTNAFFKLGDTVSYTITEQNFSTAFVNSTSTGKTYALEIAAEVAEGTYTITTTDLAGNQSSFVFYVDKTPPQVSISCGANGFSNSVVTLSSLASQLLNSYDALVYTRSVTQNATFSDVAPTSFTLVDGTISFSDRGNYRIKVKDTAGNVSTYEFTIDKTAPVLSLSVADGGFTKNAVFATWSTSSSSVDSQRANSSDALDVSYSRSATSTFPSTAELPYTSGTNLSEEGNYLIKIKDVAGNSSSYTFTIDKTAPTLTLSSKGTNYTAFFFSNGSVSANWQKIVGGVGSARTNSLDILAVKYKGSTSSDFPSITASGYSSYAEGLSLVAAGNYSIIIEDSAGNSTPYTFTIDTKAPLLSRNTSDSSVFVNNKTKGSVYISWSDTVAGADGQRINNSDALSATYTFNSGSQEVYLKNTVLATEGHYVVFLADLAGNISTSAFEIYRQPPFFSVFDLSGVELQFALAYNHDIKFSFTENISAKTCFNGGSQNAYASGTALNTEGEYILYLTDELGNTSSYTTNIIKTPPTANYNALKSPLNRWYETTTSSGQSFAFDDYDTALNTADARERAIIVQGFYSDTWSGGAVAPEDISIALPGSNYWTYKSFASASTNNAYFNLATLNKSVEKYAKNSVLTKYVPSVPIAAAPGEIVYRDIYFAKEPILFRTIALCTIFVDGVQQAYPYTLSQEGEHSIVERDAAGNSISYLVHIDTGRAVIQTWDLSNARYRALTYGATEYFTYAVRLKLDDADNQAFIRIRNEDTLEDVIYLGLGTIELRTAGIYSITTRDAAGNTGSLQLRISLRPPTVSSIENEVSGIISSFSIIVTKNYTLNDIITLGIQFSSGDGVWNDLNYDNSSSPVSIDRTHLSYTFNVSGEYRLVLFDIFGRQITELFTFTQGAPQGKVYNSADAVIVQNGSSRYTVYFTWITALDCSAEYTFNGGAPIAYIKNSALTYEGSYTMRIFPNSGNNVSNTYFFTIDKTAPTGYLTANGLALANGGTTRFAVSFDWSEPNCHATLNGENYESGSMVAEQGDYTIILYDAAGNKKQYEFRIKTAPPKGSLTTGLGNLSSYDVTKSDVYFSWSESGCTALLNGAPYEKNSKISIEGSYTIILSDLFGNINSFFFTIDKTPPSGTLYVDDLPVGNDTITNKKVYLLWEESGCIAVINKNYNYTNGSLISEAGSHSIKLTDKAGNTTSFSFIIKLNLPQLKLTANGETVQSGTATRYSVSASWSESGCTATLNGISYVKGATITTEGEHTIELTDIAGNVNTMSFTIDKTAPVITTVSNGEIITNGSLTKSAVYVYWDDIDAVGFLSGTPILNGNTVEQDGEFTLVVTDGVGNKSSVSFVIDTTAKAGTLIANALVLPNGSSTRHDVYFTWVSSNCVATLNGEPYSRSTTVKAEGQYIVVLTDAAGNVSSYSFIIDKTAPAIAISTVGQDGIIYEAISGSKSNKNTYISWSEENCTATLNGYPYVSGAIVVTEGEHRFSISDAVGNTYACTFAIDKTAPTANARTTTGLILENASSTRFSIYFTWTKIGCTATVNGKTYTKETVFSESDIYTLTLTDSVGNSTVVSIEVDKTTPSAEVSAIGRAVYPTFLEGFFCDLARPYLHGIAQRRTLFQWH